jgi:hypothetical protein
VRGETIVVDKKFIRERGGSDSTARGSKEQRGGEVSYEGKGG